MTAPLARWLVPARLALVSVALCLGLLLPAAAQAGDPTLYGIQSVGASLSTTQAGAHPDFTTTVELTTDPAGPTEGGVNPPYARTRDLAVTIPPGLIGNPTLFPQCTVVQLGTSFDDSHCPQDSQVGVTDVTIYPQGRFFEPVYLMEPPAGTDIVARIGFIAGLYPTILDIRLRPEQGYALEAKLEGASALVGLVRAETTLWGVPSAEAHDPLRLTALEAHNQEPPPGGGRASGLAPVPFMTNPTRCAAVREITVSTDSYSLPNQVSTKSAPLPAITGCGKLVFEPEFSLSPTTTAADSPSGMDAELALSQEGLRQPNVFASPHLKKAVVTLPPGMTLNPSSATGLAACSEDQIGLVSKSPIRFDSESPRCPPGSKVGTVEITTPVLPEPIKGELYLATQLENPFGALLSGYLVAQGQGATVKLAGRFEVDPLSGQITAVFDENPEQPFEKLELHFKSGSNAVLTTPLACGAYGIQAQLTPWSAPDPSNPGSSVDESTSRFAIDQGPGGSACPSGGLSAQLSAGTSNPTAGRFSPFVLRLTRPDGTPRLQGLELTLPRGLTGRLAGIPYCPEAAIAAAASLSHAGQGALEAAAPACPLASQLGTVTVGAGSGPTPFYLSTGRVYLAGPYKGAPLSFAIVTPAVAGPFDLGAVVVRTALRVDPGTAQITAASDPLPTILHGIPLDLRDLRVNIDRSGFTLNPTSCQPKEFTGVALGENGSRATLSERFQAASCASLGFRPKLAISLKGGTKRTGHPALRATLTAHPGDANLSRTTVMLPRAQFIDQSHISNPCTRVQFNEDKCPPLSVLGRAKAFTPLLDEPLQGPIYFRSNGGDRLLPDIVLDLHGQIDLVQVGFVDSKKRRIRTRFTSVPDAPITKVMINLFGGKRGLLVNSVNLCRTPQRARIEMEAQNGRELTSDPTIQTSCRKAPKRNR
jgi:hypothetical protein